MNFSQPWSGAVSSVSVQPGTIVLHRMWCRASSTARPRTSAAKPALLAA
jgi:hypothetical protein